MKNLGMEEKYGEEPVETVAPTIFVDDNELSPHRDVSRPSLENHASASDLMMHIHGLSPVRKKGSRPPRMSLQSVNTAGSFGTACKNSSVSPFPQSSISFVGQNSHLKCNEFVQT